MGIAPLILLEYRFANSGQKLLSRTNDFMETRELSTRYCVSTADGRIEPVWSEQETSQIKQHFVRGTKIDGRYLLQSSIGHGGMGHVFLAKDERLDRLVAIKVVARKRVDKQNFYESMLAREAKLGANLNHPGIATVHDFGVHGGKSYTVFEYVDGDNLRQILNNKKRLSLGERKWLNQNSQNKFCQDVVHWLNEMING
jgi:serine/threonine protein kinase